MSKTIVLALATIAFTFSASACSAQFSSIIDTIAIPKNVEHSVAWENAESIKGVKWKWPYYESGAHDHTMVGTTQVGKDKNPNIGYTEVTINGARTFITNIEINISNDGGDPSESEVKEFFGSGKVMKVVSSCDQDEPSWKVATYSFKRPKDQPVFIKYETSWGASGSGSTTLTVANQLEYLSNYGYEDCYDK